MKTPSIFVPILTAILMVSHSLLPIVGGETTTDIDYQDIVDHALDTLLNDYKQSWSYTETSTRDNETRVAIYHPRKPESESWTLVSVDGQPPTAKDKKSFQTEKRKRREKLNKRDAAIGSRATVKIRPGTLKLKEETDTHWIFDFIPAEEKDDDKIMQHLNGVLKIVKNGQYVESVVLKNKAPIKPVLGVKISTIQVKQTFEPARPDGPIVPVSVDVQINGRAFLLMILNESEKVCFSNYKYVGD